jgi:hypothetical protein
VPLDQGADEAGAVRRGIDARGERDDALLGVAADEGALARDRIERDEDARRAPHVAAPEHLRRPVIDPRDPSARLTRAGLDEQQRDRERARRAGAEHRGGRVGVVGDDRVGSETPGHERLERGLGRLSPRVAVGLLARVAVRASPHLSVGS